MQAVVVFGLWWAFVLAVLARHGGLAVILLAAASGFLLGVLSVVLQRWRNRA